MARGTWDDILGTTYSGRRTRDDVLGTTYRPLAARRAVDHVETRELTDPNGCLAKSGKNEASRGYEPDFPIGGFERD
jgi:hypothetical protein